LVIILFLVIILLISNSQLVINGASYGLMLWYKNVLPLLLPFMLISGLLENSVISSDIELATKKKLAIPTIVLLGLFCGYPIGAKTNAFFLKKGLIDKKTGNILLPICNNVSPMFFMGFILNRTLDNHANTLLCYIAMFIPYLLIILLEIFIYPKDKTKLITKNNSSIKQASYIPSTRSISEQSINQITHVGLYIMLCSIIAEFVLSFEFLSPMIKLLSTGITEITRGVTYIGNSYIVNKKIKTALILSITSFGGISSIMQTTKVIQGSGLSLIHYTVVKILCSICTYFLYLLII